MQTSKAIGFILLLLLANCGKSADGASGSPGAAGAAVRSVPVVTAVAQRRDLPVYLDGLGTVTAYATVSVRAQVDGRLDKLFFKEGQPVKKGEALAQIDPRPYQNQLHQAEGQFTRDQATLDTNKQNLARYEDLAQQKFIAAQQADDQRGLVAQGQAALRMDQAAIDVAKLNLEYAHITSPVDGVAGIRNVDAGNLVHASDPTAIVTITQLDPIAVIFTLPQDALPQVSLHQAEGSLEVIVFSRDGETELGRGKLEVIDNAINTSTGTLRFKAVLPNPGHALWPNQFVKARLMLTVRSGVVVIPAPALQRGPAGLFVYVVANDTAQARPVTVELLQGDDALIAKGLEQGDTVVIEGQNQLRPGSKVALRAKAGDASQPPAAAGGKPAVEGGKQGAADHQHQRQEGSRAKDESKPVAQETP